MNNMENKKYVITLFVRDFDIDGLTEYFKILAVCDTLEKAEFLLPVLSDRTVAAGIADQMIKRNMMWKESGVRDYQKSGPHGVGPFDPPNAHNTIIAKEVRHISWIPCYDYDRIYYYLELVEFPVDTVITKELFSSSMRAYDYDVGMEYFADSIQYGANK